MWWEQHTVITENSAHATRISPEPSFLVQGMDALYLCDVIRGQAVSASHDHRTNQQNRDRQNEFAHFREASWRSLPLWTPCL